LRWRLAQFQFRPKKADVDANLRTIGEALRVAADHGAHLALFPEACLSGYFLMGGVEEVAIEAEDLVSTLQAQFVADRPDENIEVSIGFYERDGGAIYNSALHARLGATKGDAPLGLIHLHRKIFLPSYGVFDEDRYVTRGRFVECYDTPLGRMVMLICEDAWHSICGTIAALHGAEYILIPSASPARNLTGDVPENVTAWNRVTSLLASEHGCFVARTDLMGFEGGKGFAGTSTVHGPDGDLVSQGPMLEEAMVITDVNSDDITITRRRSPLIGSLQETIAVLASQLMPDALEES
jgi:predicted amidohydrolase